MTGTARRLVVIAGLALLVLLAIWALPRLLDRLTGVMPDPVVQEQQRQDARRAAAALAENARLRDVAAALAESVAVHQQSEATFKASADRKAQRIAWLESRRYIAGTDIQKATVSGTPSPRDSQRIDPAASCEERYQLRSGEAADLRLALRECDQAGHLQEVRGDSLATANGRLATALQRSESARRAEIVRPRPCRRNLVLAHPSCSVVDALLLGGGFVLGVVVVR